MKSDNSSFLAYLHAASNEITNELTAYLTEWENNAKKSAPELQDELNYFVSSVFGGKMLRGTLVKLGYELAGMHSSNKILKPAAAYEIIHTALLTHDDIIDQSHRRRGKPTVHTTYENKHYGLSQALCLGDLGITIANKMIAESNFPDTVKVKALTNFMQIISETLIGEMLDVRASQNEITLEKQIFHIHEKKTAQYSIVGPLSLGSLLGGADNNLIESISDFGKPLGIAYQLNDDILGIFETADFLGKSTTSDIEENKSTLLSVYAMKYGTAHQKQILKKIYGKKNITDSQQNQIRDVFEKTGALAYSEEKIRILRTKAISHIPAITKDVKKQVLLTQFAQTILARKKKY